jgi:hypothetical protein
MKILFRLTFVSALFFLMGTVSHASTLPFYKEVNAPNYKLDFTLVNKTGYTISHIYVAPTQQYEWGDDIMEKDMLLNEEEVDISFSTEETAKNWDIYVKWDGYDTEEDVYWVNFDLSKISKITLFYDAKTNKTWAEFE